MESKQKKLLASDVIEIDDVFIGEVKKRLKIDDKEDRDILWTVNKVASKAGLKVGAVRKHIKNFIENRDGRKLKAEKMGKSWYIQKEDLEEYLNLKL